MRRLVCMVHIYVLSTSLVFCVMQASVKAAHGLKSRRLVDGRDSYLLNNFQVLTMVGEKVINL